MLCTLCSVKKACTCCGGKCITHPVFIQGSVLHPRSALPEVSVLPEPAEAADARADVPIQTEPILTEACRGARSRSQLLVPIYRVSNVLTYTIESVKRPDIVHFIECQTLLDALRI